MIKELTEKDIPQVVALVNSAYRGEEAKKGWTTEAHFLKGTRIDEETLSAHFLSGHHTLLGRWQDGELLACIEIELTMKKQRTGHLGMFSVQPSHQNQGIGAQVLSAAENWLKDRGVRLAVMEVISRRQELIDWYLRKGYRDTGRREAFEPEKSDFAQTKLSLEFAILEKPL